MKPARTSTLLIAFLLAGLVASGIVLWRVRVTDEALVRDAERYCEALAERAERAQLSPGRFTNNAERLRLPGVPLPILLEPGYSPRNAFELSIDTRDRGTVVDCRFPDVSRGRARWSGERIDGRWTWERTSD